MNKIRIAYDQNKKNIYNKNIYIYIYISSHLLIGSQIKKLGLGVEARSAPRKIFSRAPYKTKDVKNDTQVPLRAPKQRQLKSSPK